MNTNDEGYPNRVEDVLDPAITFDPKVVRTVERFARSKPWRGTRAQRQTKFRRLHLELARAYGISPPRLLFAGSIDTDSGRSCYMPRLDTIVLHGLSVVTFLHEWGHKLHGRSEYEACRWSINLFRRCFPRSFAACRFDGHLLRKRR